MSTDLEQELGTSTEYLRIAAQELENKGYPAMARMLRGQADRNIELLTPLAKR
jgi:hypothetical protein